MMDMIKTAKWRDKKQKSKGNSDLLFLMAVMENQHDLMADIGTYIEKVVYPTMDRHEKTLEMIRTILGNKDVSKYLFEHLTPEEIRVIFGKGAKKKRDKANRYADDGNGTGDARHEEPIEQLGQG